MFKLITRSLKTGIKTNPVTRPSREMEVLGEKLLLKIKKRFSGSLAIRLVDAGSCNGCELEIHAVNNCYYDIERFGVTFTASPRFADMLLVTGPVGINMVTALKMTYDAVPNPKLVVAVGDCAVDCGPFGKDNYAVSGAVGDIIPVDVVIKGCPPEPADIIKGVLSAILSSR